MFRIAFIVWLLLATPVWASIGGIGNAQVDKGVLTVHWRTAYAADDSNAANDGRWRNRLMLDYGVTDNYAFGVYVQTDRSRGDGEFEALMIDQRFEFHTVAEDGFYSGIRLRYTYKDGDKKPDNAHVRFILGAPLGNWEVRTNQLVAHEVGEGSRGGMLYESRMQATYAYWGSHRIGLESFNNFGNLSASSSFDSQHHEIGPVFQGRITDRLSYDAGYRTGISDAAIDHVFRLFLVQRF